jgi:hypothetical protein
MTLRIKVRDYILMYDYNGIRNLGRRSSYIECSVQARMITRDRNIEAKRRDLGYIRMLGSEDYGT